MVLTAGRSCRGFAASAHGTIRLNRPPSVGAPDARLPNHHPQPPHVVITTHHITAHCPSVTNDDGITRNPSGVSDADHTDIPQYEIRVKGHLGHRWAAWFDGLSLTALDDGTTVMSGPVVDQAALHGLLHKLRDVGIPLISLTLLPPDAPATRTVTRAPNSGRKLT
jgi:hypothetical protein